VVNSERICNLRGDVGKSTVPSNSSLAFVVSFTIRLREQISYALYIFIFILSFPNFIPKFTAVITLGNYHEDEL
jgi:hypothetical protein